MGTKPAAPAQPDSPRIECWCNGSPREMGLIQGTTLKAKIRAAYSSLWKLDALRLEQPWWLPFPLFLRLAESKTERPFIAALSQSDPAMLARLHGLADGAGLPLRSFCLMNAMEALIATVEDRVVIPPLGACSALAVRGSHSRTGEPVIARNFDYLRLFQPFYTLRESRPRDGFRSLDFTVAPLAGTVDGVNEKGLAITLNYAFVTDMGQPNPLVTMAIADALATCATVEEALGRIAARRRWGAGMLMLADDSGDIASLELSSSRAGVRRPEKGADWLVFTNVCHCAETRAVQVPDSATYAGNVPAPLRHEPVLRAHAERARRLEELVRRQSRLDPDELAAIMSDHGPTGAPDGASPCVHAEFFSTTATFQWFPRRRSVRVSFTSACTAHYVEIGL